MAADLALCSEGKELFSLIVCSVYRHFQPLFFSELAANFSHTTYCHNVTPMPPTISCWPSHLYRHYFGVITSFTANRRDNPAPPLSTIAPFIQDSEAEQQHETPVKEANVSVCFRVEAKVTCRRAKMCVLMCSSE